MAKSLRRRLNDALVDLDARRNEIYAAAPTNNVPWNQCWLRATGTVQDNFLRAQSRADELESQAIAAGKAWRNSLGLLSWYR